ncbi:hypothetical protein [Vibrio sp. Vb0888]|uniref:hypothetical protein n=1 Tax=Vibrio sp. Vb0888 TaxID=3074632 RepID=UPI002964D586|nr:hypothetical protein [Vibrio sp. Vb0888]MDF5110265.1 hypothetical protein [Vibrio parahaemolyticus]MDF5262937.1 hypothetical protein [Vibrio parahaemolyticus]MDG2556345.1 hypothetical protein [Vibrio parahaemolyticus]MDW1850611.1 hypothetical protein [Vibrio sp. Vb0888]HCH3768669.1 hypothetical protein [Vibrio parahaemolyticus]
MVSDITAITIHGRSLRYLKRFLFICLLLSTVSCTTYDSFSVIPKEPSNYVRDQPKVNLSPLIQSDEYNIYQDSSDDSLLYLIPTKLHLGKSYNHNLLSISVERSDGEHMILTSLFIPNERLLETAKIHLNQHGVSYKRLTYYPIKNLFIEPITDPQEPGLIKLTAVPGLIGTEHPFSVLTVFYVSGYENILGFKQAVKSELGYVLSLRFFITFDGDFATEKSKSIQLVLKDAVVTNLTI